MAKQCFINGCIYNLENINVFYNYKRSICNTVFIKRISLSGKLILGNSIQYNKKQINFIHNLEYIIHIIDQTCITCPMRWLRKRPLNNVFLDYLFSYFVNNFYTIQSIKIKFGMLVYFNWVIFLLSFLFLQHI